MLKRKPAPLIFILCVCVLFAGCGSADVSSTNAVDVEEEPSAGSVPKSERTSITFDDLKAYIDLDSVIYVVQGSSISSISSFSYDSDVIKSVSLDTSGVDTNADPGLIGTMYDADCLCVVDVNALCKKENQTNGMAGDTAQVAGTVKVDVITRDYAEGMIDNGANPEKIIGY